MLNDFGCGVCNGEGIISEVNSIDLPCICPQCMGHKRVKIISVPEGDMVDLTSEDIDKLTAKYNGGAFGEFTSDMLVKWMEMGEELYIQDGLPDELGQIYLMPNPQVTDKKE